MHVKRQRRTATNGPGILGHSSTRRRRLVVVGTSAALALSGGVAWAGTTSFGQDEVGQQTARGLVLPSDQTIDPIGDRLLVDNGKLLASTISPDGTRMAATTNDRAIALTIVDLKSYRVQQQAGTSPDADLKISGNNVGQEGPTYSPDGKFLWLPQTNGFNRFPVAEDGSLEPPTFITLPTVDGKRPLPAQATFSEDGTRMFAAVNGQNTVVEMDPETGGVVKTWQVGNAPRGLVRVGDKLYVSNEGGRRARPGDPTMNSYNTEIVANRRTGSSTTGTVSVIDLASPSAPVDTIKVGLHPTAMEAGGGVLFVTNTNSDEVSVIDTEEDVVTQTIATRPWPSAEVGYHPNGVTLTDDGRLLVTLGRANAVAVYRYSSPQEPVSYVGLLPTDYYPTEVETLDGKVLVTNLRGIGNRGPGRTIAKGPGTTPATGRNTHDSTGTVQRFTLPEDTTTARLSRTVFEQNGWDATSIKRARGRRAAAVPVPRRLGDPSKIKYVYLIVKENRTYDQLFGDMPQGNGDPSMAQFGEDVTPNQHALARQFGLYDNAYAIGTNSAEGHNWLMQSDDPEYTESSAGAYVRSYDTQDDVLGHQRSGFLWTAVQAAGKTVRNFGEFTKFETKPADARWQDFYCEALNMDETGADTSIKTTTSSPIPSLNKVTVPEYPKYDLDIPDIYRYEIWKRDFERNGPANLNMMWLSSDHTGGPPNPVAQVADNDLTVGKIVEKISTSKYWRKSAIFVIEDDTQNGVDHVDGTRGPIQVISPWSQDGKVDSRYYTQITMIRTIEQILGAQPMNQKDTAATPMYSAFNKKPDFTPFEARPNRIPLTYGVSPQPACGGDTVAKRFRGLAPAERPVPSVPADQKEVAQLWRDWMAQVKRRGGARIPDLANPEQMDRYTWYEANGYRRPYPGDGQILTPAQVPGRYLPSPEFDG